jgi:beta-N-acetylhexosaminidase
VREGVRQAGERLIVGFHGHEASADVKRMIRDYGAGTVILFARNVASRSRWRSWSELQAVARAALAELPLFIAVDQEGGRVARMRRGVASRCARWGSRAPDVARKGGEALAAGLFACGIRLDFAPVMDVDTNPRTRSSGTVRSATTPTSWAAWAWPDPRAPGRRCRRLGQAPRPRRHRRGLALRHAVRRAPARGWRTWSCRPFRKAIEAGVATVMTGHVLVRARRRAAGTLSPRVVGGLLRRDLGYQGVIVTDDLEMKAVAERWPRGEAAALAAQSGCDMLSVCATHDRQAEALEAVVKALESEAISRSDMDDACLRIRRLKEKYLVPWQDPDPRAARAAAGAGERQALAREVAEYSA